MANDQFKHSVKACLEEFGYKASIIPKNNITKRADLYAECDSDTLIVEVKIKLDDKETYEALKKAKPQQQVAYCKTLKHQPHLSSLIEHAEKQIQATRELYPHAFGIIWFCPITFVGFRDSDKQIKLNLYGGQYAFVDKSDEPNLYMPCYGVTYSDFYRYCNVDAVILNIDDGTQLLANPFSRRHRDFEGTQLYCDHKESSALWTPDLEVSAGTALSINGHVDLKDNCAIIAELEKQNPGYKIDRFVDLLSLGGMMNL